MEQYTTSTVKCQYNSSFGMGNKLYNSNANKFGGPSRYISA